MTKDELNEKIHLALSKASRDSAFKKRLLIDPMRTLKAEGVELPADIEIRAVTVWNNLRPRVALLKSPRRPVYR